MKIVARLKRVSAKTEEISLNYDEACSLLGRELNTLNSVYFESDFINLDFYLFAENKIGVEIYDVRDGFWGHAEITPQIAKKIIEIACENKHFEDVIPLTEEEWGAFGRNG
jgi:hypothetical protein